MTLDLNGISTRNTLCSEIMALTNTSFDTLDRLSGLDLIRLFLLVSNNYSGSLTPLQNALIQKCTYVLYDDFMASNSGKIKNLSEGLHNENKF
jgi:hypothetical protein